MKKLWGYLAALMTTVLLSVGAHAQSTPVVVELFTSQGCSSCPPADEYLGRLADREDVIALSLHVDYWDYLGWKDVYGQTAHTERQRNYARFMRERMVYTPQMVINGSEGLVGSRVSLVEAAISAQKSQPAAVIVGVALKGDSLSVELAPGEATSEEPGRILMAWYTRAENVAIGGGENRGREITYHNVVHGWADLGLWKGAAQSLLVPKPMWADGVAVLVQTPKGGPIIGAGRLWLAQ